MDQISSTLIHLLTGQAALYAEKPLFTFFSNKTNESEGITYQEMLSKATQIAQHLATLTHFQDRVIILLSPGIDLMTAFFGCVLSGNIAILHYPPTNKKLINKLYKIAKNAGAKIVIGEPSIIEKIQQDQPEDIGLNEFSLQWLNYQDFFLKKPTFHGTLPLVNPSDIAFLQYTSGSTGNPKGVMVTHENIIHNLKMMQIYCDINSTTNIVSWLPPYHDLGLILCHLEALYSGTSGYYIAPHHFLQNPKKWLTLLTEYSPAFSVAPNFAFDYCVERIEDHEKEDLDLSQVVTLGNAAEPVNITTLKRFYESFKKCGLKKSVLRPAYGLAEATLYVTSEIANEDFMYSCYSYKALKNNLVVSVDSDAPEAHPLVSCGVPFPTLKIVNPDTQEELGEKMIGEIWLNSQSVAKGYWRNEEVTKEIFHAALKNDTSATFYLRTGDLGFLDNKKLYITGRLKDLIIIRGNNFYPQDIEYTMENSHNSIRRSGSAAFPLHFSEGAEYLGVVCEVDTKDPEQYNEICQAIRTAVHSQHELDIYQIILIPARKIPKTTSGKVQRKQCKEGIENGEIPVLYRFQQQTVKQPVASSVSKTPLANITPWALLDWFQKWLEKENCIIPGKLSDCNFAECGIDSLKATQIASELTNYLNIPLDPTLLWEQETFGELAEFLAEKVKESGQ